MKVYEGMDVDNIFTTEYNTVILTETFLTKQIMQVAFASVRLMENGS
jgi:hypothetical protein